MKKFIISYSIAVILVLIILSSDWIADFSSLLSLALAYSAKFCIQIFDDSIMQQGAVLLHQFTGRYIEVTEECNALEATLLLIAAILIFPAPFKHKLYGVILGVCILQGLNILRIISLYYILAFYAEWFTFVHEYLWRGLILLDMLLLFIGWMLFSIRTQQQGNHANQSV